MMLASLLALGSGVGWGTSDYLGGRASKRFGTLRVLVISQLVAFVLLGAGVAVLHPPFPDAPAAWAGIVAGVGELVGVAALYRGLATGVTGIVAPSASAAPLVPLTVGVVLGSVPGPWQLAGVALVVVGVVMTSIEPRDVSATAAGRVRLRSVGWGAVAAAGFGVYMVAMDTAAAGGVPWALLLARGTGAVIVVTAILVTRARTRAAHETPRTPRDVAGIALIGAIILAADALYASSTEFGQLALVAVLSSTHPVVTVILARFHGQERLQPLRIAGIAVTVVGVVAITVL